MMPSLHMLAQPGCLPALAARHMHSARLFAPTCTPAHLFRAVKKLAGHERALRPHALHPRLRPPQLPQPLTHGGRAAAAAKQLLLLRKGGRRCRQQLVCRTALFQVRAAQRRKEAGVDFLCGRRAVGSRVGATKRCEHMR